MNIVVAVVERDNQYLVVRRKQPVGKLVWTLPGGKPKDSEPPAATAVREVVEETQVWCRTLRSLGGRVHPETGAQIEYWWCYFEHGQAQPGNSREVAEVRWVTGPVALQLFETDVFPPVRELLLRHT